MIGKSVVLALAAACSLAAPASEAESLRLAQATNRDDPTLKKAMETLSPQLEEKLRNLGVRLIDQRVLSATIAVPVRSGSEKDPVVTRDEPVEDNEGRLVRIPVLLRKTVSYRFGGEPGQPVASIALTGAYYVWPNRADYVQVITIRSLTTPRQNERGQKQIDTAALPPTQAQINLFREILKQTGFTPSALDECLKNGSHKFPPPKPIQTKPPSREELAEETKRAPYTGPVEACAYSSTNPLSARFQFPTETLAVN